MNRYERCERMRRAKAARREALGSVGCVEIGTAVFEGPTFGGRHVVRLLCREDEAREVAVEVDGSVTCVRTRRGALALLMRRIGKAAMAGKGMGR
jgi:hypothetical protein